MIAMADYLFYGGGDERFFRLVVAFRHSVKNGTTCDEDAVLEPIQSVNQAGQQLGLILF
jgi:hypothetical protein